MFPTYIVSHFMFSIFFMFHKVVDPEETKEREALFAEVMAVCFRTIIVI